jgi:hypothetical protein
VPDPVRPFPRARLDAFFAAVLINDVVDAELVLPAGIPVHQPQGRLADYHALCRQLWIEGVDRTNLRQLSGMAIAGRSPDPETLTRFKHVRAKFKQLRYASTLLDQDYRTPLLLGAATAVMGQLQDAYRHHQLRQIRLHGLQLRILTTRPCLAWMGNTAAAFQPLPSRLFAERLGRDLDELAEQLASGPVSGKAFHAMRKIVSRHNSFWTAMTVIHPATSHHRLFRWMSAVNGMMGAMHDGLVAAEAERAGSYEQPAPLPDDLRAMLDKLVGLPRWTACED